MLDLFNFSNFFYLLPENFPTSFLLKILSALFFPLMIHGLQQKTWKFEDFYLQNKSTKAFFDFMKFFFLFFILLHYYSCFWISIGFWQNQQIIDQMANKSNIYIYFLSVKDMFGTFLMRQPLKTETYLEMVYVSIIFALNFLIFCFNIKKFIAIVQNLTSDKSQNKISDILIKKKIDFITRKKIEHYLQFDSEQPLNEDNIENLLLEKLPQTLKNDLLKQENLDICNKIPSFRNFSSSTIHKIITQFEEKTLTPGETIFENGLDPSLYIFQEGELELKLKSSNFSKNLKKWDILG